MKRRLEAFTIVELLIVVVVISILAAVTVVAYSGVQSQSHDSVVKNDLQTLQKKIEMFAVSKGAYPAYAADFPLLEFNATTGSYETGSRSNGYNIAFCYQRPDNNIYAVVAMSKSGEKYWISNTHGVEAYTGSWPATSALLCLETLTQGYTGDTRGYAAEDTTTGPWRAWVGGN